MSGSSIFADLLSTCVFRHQITTALNMLAQNSTQLESNIVSVERIVEYVSLTQEVSVCTYRCTVCTYRCTQVVSGKQLLAA